MGRPGARSGVELDLPQEGADEDALLLHGPEAGHPVHVRRQCQGGLGQFRGIALPALLLQQRLLLPLQLSVLGIQLLYAPVHVFAVGRGDVVQQVVDGSLDVGLALVHLGQLGLVESLTRGELLLGHLPQLLRSSLFQVACDDAPDLLKHPALHLLLGQHEPLAAGAALGDIAPQRIRDNDWNPNAFDAASYLKLVESIREKGMLEPLKVMPDTPAGGSSVPQRARRQVANLGLRVCNLRGSP